MCDSMLLARRGSDTSGPTGRTTKMASRDNHERWPREITTRKGSRGHVRIVQRPPLAREGTCGSYNDRHLPRGDYLGDSAGTGPEDYQCCLLREGHERRPREMASKYGLENGQRKLPRRRTVLVLVRRTTGAVLYPTSRLTHHPTQRQPADRKVGSRDPRAMRA